MTEFEAQVVGDLKVLKSQMEQILGIGQKGRLAQIERQLTMHDQNLQRMKGMMGAVGGILTVVHIAIDFVVGRR